MAFVNAGGRVVYDGRVVDFVSCRIGGKPDKCTAVGWEASSGEITAGALFDHCNGHNVFLHGAANGSKIFNRALLRAIAHHAFVTLGVERITTVTQSSNLAALSWDTRFGFAEEGRMRGAAHDGSDSIYLVLWKKDCRWLPDEHDHIHH